MSFETVAFKQGYAAAHDGAVVVDRSTLGMLKLTGETRIDLIHRMSTQNLLGMQSGEGRATVLTTDIGRIIDRVILYAGSDKVYMLTSENNADRIALYLMRFVFFNDDFQIEDLSSWVSVLGVYGAKATEKVDAAFGGGDPLPLHHYRKIELGKDAYLHRTDAVAGDGYLIICNSDDVDAMVAALGETGVAPVDHATYDHLRIESGVPGYGAELSSDYIPLETGLWDDVSFNKGCYTGQEIIARMESRGKLAKQMVRFSAETPIQPNSDITANGKNAGTITSASGTVALGYLKTKFLEEGELMAGDVHLAIHH